MIEISLNKYNNKDKYLDFFEAHIKASSETKASVFTRLKISKATFCRLKGKDTIRKDEILTSLSKYYKITIENAIKGLKVSKELVTVYRKTSNTLKITLPNKVSLMKFNATDEECIEAAKLTGADDFITRLPDGYNTQLKNNGSNLSQGQRQLIAISRAAVADPPCLILDEATSSIDTRTERIIQESMDRLMHGRTTFVIAHRLSTVKNSDCIMVLEQGRIIERGTHDQLLEEKGKYYQLYTGNAIGA